MIRVPSCLLRFISPQPHVMVAQDGSDFCASPQRLFPHQHRLLQQGLCLGCVNRHTEQPPCPFFPYSKACRMLFLDSNLPFLGSQRSFSTLLYFSCSQHALEVLWNNSGGLCSFLKGFHILVWHRPLSHLWKRPKVLYNDVPGVMTQDCLSGMWASGLSKPPSNAVFNYGVFAFLWNKKSELIKTPILVFLMA